MTQANLDELVAAAAEKPSSRNIENLLNAIRQHSGNLSAEIAAQLNLLWDAWDLENLENPQANFCLELAALNHPSTPAFREALSESVQRLLPPYLSGLPFLRALGLRDESMPINEIVWRFRKLSVLKNGTILFRAGGWGVAGAPDSTSGTLPVSLYGGRGHSVAVPMESVLKDAAFFSPGLELNRLTDPAKAAALTSHDFRTLTKRRAISNVSETQMKAMAQATAGKVMEPTAFEKWWSAEASPSAAPVAGAGRRASAGRSLAEIELLFDKETAAGCGKFSDEEVAELTGFFERLKPETAFREALALAKVITKLRARTDDGGLTRMLSPLREKAPFWPADPSRASLEKLAVWGEIPARDTEALAAATNVIFSENYLAECALRLPLKALNAVCAAVPEEVLFDTLSAVKSCGSDLLLWIWKNRKTVESELLTLINIENVIRSLSQEQLPKAWGPAQRELRVQFLDKAEFQKQIIESSNDDAMAIAATLQGALFLNPGERQSLLVKLSRHSTELRDYIENGAGQRILNAGLTAADKKVEVPKNNEPNFTSIRSHERLLQELDDIINRHVPENREALKIARAHGDFRENAEFDAAKERRNFLTHRRNELERELTRIQPVSFKRVKLEDFAVIGCRVDLENDGEISTYYLLGAWDGNPEKNYLSYRTRLGQSLLNRQVGEVITMPNGSERKIAAIKPLPPEILSEME